MNIESWLKEFGLNETEISVYLAVLKRPGQKISDLQKELGMVRTTLYHSVHGLKQKSLVSEAKTNNVAQLFANSPAVLRQEFEARATRAASLAEDVSELESQLLALQSSDEVRGSSIERFEGVEGVKQAIEQAFRCNDKRWLIVAPYSNFLTGCSKQYQNYYLKEKERRSIRSKTLWDPQKEIKQSSLQQMLFRAPRKLPEGYKDQFKVLTILYDSTTLFIEDFDSKTATAVHSQQVSDVMRVLFVSAWDGAERFELG